MTTKTSAKTQMRDLEALRMRAAGMYYSAIGAEMNVTKGTAYKMVERAMGELTDERQHLADKYRALEIDRLEALHERLWPIAMLSADVRVVDRLLHISEQRARLLGLYSPQQLEVTGKGGGPIEVDVRAARENMATRLISLSSRVVDIQRVTDDREAAV